MHKLSNHLKLVSSGEIHDSPNSLFLSESRRNWW